MTRSYHTSPLIQGKPAVEILKFTLPIFLGNLFNLAYSLADTRIVGSFLGNEALAAVGSVSSFNDLLLGFLIGLANGFSIITAQTYGKGQISRIRKTFSMSLLSGTGIALFCGAVCLVGLHPILNLLHIPVEQQVLSSSYIRVIFAGLIFSAFYNVLAASLRAIGDSFTPLIFLILSACINVGLDILFVTVFQMGVAGAAVATVLSQLISAVLCFSYAWRKYDYLRFSLEDFKPEAAMIRQMLPSGFSMGFMNCLVLIGTVSLQTAINQLGVNTIVAHSSTRKLTTLFMMPHSSLGVTLSTYVGQNFGAGRFDRIRQGLKITVGFCFCWVLVVILMANTICGNLIVAITDTKIEEVIQTACLYQRVDTLFYPIPVMISLFRNSLQGMGDHRTPIISSGLELITKVIVAFALTPAFGYWAIIWAEPIAWTLMVIPLGFSLWKTLQRGFAVNKEQAL